MLSSLHSVYSRSCSLYGFLFFFLRDAKDGLSRLRLQYALYLLLLVTAQSGAEDGAAITAEMARHDIRVGRAQQRIDCRVAGLDQRPDILDKVIGDTEFILPPRSVEGT